MHVHIVRRGRPGDVVDLDVGSDVTLVVGTVDGVGGETIGLRFVVEGIDGAASIL